MKKRREERYAKLLILRAGSTTSVLKSTGLALHIILIMLVQASKDFLRRHRRDGLAARLMAYVMLLIMFPVSILMLIVSLPYLVWGTRKMVDNLKQLVELEEERKSILQGLAE